MSKISLVPRHSFLGELVPREDGTGYRYVWEHSLKKADKTVFVEFISDNYDDSNKESEENKPFLKQLKKNIKH